MSMGMIFGMQALAERRRATEEALRAAVKAASEELTDEYQMPEHAVCEALSSRALLLLSACHCFCCVREAESRCI